MTKSPPQPPSIRSEGGTTGLSSAWEASTRFSRLATKWSRTQENEENRDTSANYIETIICEQHISGPEWSLKTFLTVFVVYFSPSSLLTVVTYIFQYTSTYVKLNSSIEYKYQYSFTRYIHDSVLYYIQYYVQYSKQTRRAIRYITIINHIETNYSIQILRKRFWRYARQQWATSRGNTSLLVMWWLGKLKSRCQIQ